MGPPTLSSPDAFFTLGSCPVLSLAKGKSGMKETTKLGCKISTPSPPQVLDYILRAPGNGERLWQALDPLPWVVGGISAWLALLLSWARPGESGWPKPGGQSLVDGGGRKRGRIPGSGAEGKAGLPQSQQGATLAAPNLLEGVSQALSQAILGYHSAPPALPDPQPELHSYGAHCRFEDRVRCSRPGIWWRTCSHSSADCSLTGKAGGTGRLPSKPFPGQVGRAPAFLCRPGFPPLPQQVV